MMWTLTVLRSGIQGPVEELEEAEFRFGRRDVELEEAPIRRLSGHQKLRRVHTNKSFRYPDNLLSSARIQEIFHHRNRYARKDDDSDRCIL